jgi:hypothetical protein
MLSSLKNRFNTSGRYLIPTGLWKTPYFTRVSEFWAVGKPISTGFLAQVDTKMGL